MIQKMDYTKLGFEYTKTHCAFVSYYKDGAWDEGQLIEEDEIKISMTSPALHYAQQAFEGLKAYRTKEGTIQLFRPDQNARRLQTSCRRLLMPIVEEEKFMHAVKKVVQANADFVPPYESKASLYIRPFVIGIGHNMGLRPAREYLFAIVVSPVGPYFKGGLTPVNFVVSDYDRAAPMGTGDVKVGGNYAASLYPQSLAKQEGFADCIYLDPATHTKIEEVGAANFFGITHHNEFVTPKSPSILPSITKSSLMHIAREYLGMVVKEEEMDIKDLHLYKEAAACGTAAVISPIGGISYQGHLHVFYSETEVGPVTKKLYDTLTKIHYGDLEAPEGWIVQL